jgi:hypothetical protein
VPSVNFTDYDLITGAILYSATCNGREPLVPTGVGRVKGKADAQVNFVNLATKRFNKRRKFRVGVLRDGDVVTISDLPAGVTVWVDGDSYLVNDGVFELTLDQPVSVSILLEHPHYLQREVVA